MRILFTFLTFWYIGPLFSLFAQTFIKITDSSNPIVSTQIDANYSGAAWIDYDNDGDLDLFVTKSFLFRNNNNGNFTLINSVIGEDFLNSGGNGITAGDFDNDGLIDIFIAGNPSALYSNSGNNSFELISEGDLLLDKRGWAAAWGDYDNDGFIDLVITHPAGFVGTPTPSHFYYNDGDGRFTKLFDFEFTQINKAYTVATWSDYDLDGDIDLFIASGPALGQTAPDNLYKNMLTETGFANLMRIDTSPIATDEQDGQVWNWIDFDNDGDLDAYVTNYQSAPNRFYRNDNGTYVSVNNELVFGGFCLANAWGDFDNDGFLDVIITSEAGNFFFKNNGDGTFTSVNNAISEVNTATRGLTIGDFNNNGLLDVFISGNAQGKGLFRNDTQNNNNWVNVSLKGTVSNSSAIGAKVKAKATINGNSVWQFREVSAQNSFNGHNSLRVHFGLGDATVIDSLIIEWPSANVEIFTNLNVNQFYNYTEEIPSGFLRANFTADRIVAFKNDPIINFTDLSITNPNQPVTSWEWDFNNDGITDATEQNPSWAFPGLGEYTIKLTVSNGSSVSKTRENYIKIQRTPGFPELNFYLPLLPDTTIPKNGSVNFVTSAMDTTGYEISYRWFKNSQSVSIDSFYNYISLQFQPERTDTVKVEITNGYNIIERTWFVHVMNSTDVTDDNVPGNYSLEQNYPNPFNPETRIKFSLPQAETVKIKIYNLLGNEIATLVNEFKPAGIYEVNFNSTDYKYLSSGLYFYTIYTGNFTSTKKMLLIK